MPQSLSQMYVHIIFSTKEQIPFLKDIVIRKEMHAYLASIIKAYTNIPLIVGGVEDHIHILCVLSKTNTLAKVVGETKRNSSKWIKTKDAIYSDFLWQRGYGAFSVSHSQIKRVHRYINNQEQHHKKISFKEEYLDFLKKHEQEFDDRYLWD